MPSASDALREMLATLRRNKLRAGLTGFSVAWGMFMLVVLLGAGNGLSNGVGYEFRDQRVNSLWVYAGKTTLPYAGRGPGREVKLSNDDYALIRRSLPAVDRIAGRYDVHRELTVSCGAEHAAFDIRGTHPDHAYLERTHLTRGRFLDQGDLAEQRKVCVLGVKAAAFLFDKQSPLGRYIQIQGLPYEVVGVFEGAGGQSELDKIYIPITTAQLVYDEPGRIHELLISFGSESLASSRALAERLHQLIARAHDVAPNDRRALHIQTNLEKFERVNAVFVWIRAFVYLVGGSTLFVGAMGVSNLMLISVKERTREIGVRKALGATTGSVVALVVGEAVLVTGTAGYSGMVLGVAVIELARRYLKDVPYLREPHVGLAVSLSASALLVGAGILAGFFPARYAARIHPIEALRG